MRGKDAGAPPGLQPGLARDGRGGSMGSYRREWVAALSLAAVFSIRPACGQVTTTIENGTDGMQYRVTRQTVPTQVLVPQTVPQQQTTYRQQVTTDNVPHQQVYNV